MTWSRLLKAKAAAEPLHQRVLGNCKVRNLMSGLRSQHSLGPSHAARLLREGKEAKKQEIIAELQRRQVRFSESMTKQELRELLKFSASLVLRDAPGIPIKRSTIDGAALKIAIAPSMYEDGGSYEGELVEGLRCGHGIHKLPNGGFY